MAQGGLTLPAKVVHENQLLGDAAANVLAGDEEADRRLYHKLQHTQAGGAADARGAARTSPDAPRQAAQSAEDSYVKKENVRLRTELDNLHRIIQDSVATARGGDVALHAELAQLRIHNARLAADRTTERDSAISLGAFATSGAWCRSEPSQKSGRTCAQPEGQLKLTGCPACRSQGQARAGSRADGGRAAWRAQ